MFALSRFCDHLPTAEVAASSWPHFARLSSTSRRMSSSYPPVAIQIESAGVFCPFHRSVACRFPSVFWVDSFQRAPRVPASTRMASIVALLNAPNSRNLIIMWSSASSNSSSGIPVFVTGVR
eukprot:1177910-Prorocentrum_minimum.AAC.4